VLFAIRNKLLRTASFLRFRIVTLNSKCFSSFNDLLAALIPIVSSDPEAIISSATLKVRKSQKLFFVFNFPKKTKISALASKNG
jgi:hypothetical protein